MPRRLFQIHLSTALVLMLLASGLLALNLVERPRSSELVRGWPWTLVTRSPVVYSWVGELPRGPKEAESNQTYTMKPFHWKRLLAANIAVALTILAGTTVLLEWRLRRRNRIKRHEAKVR